MPPQLLQGLPASNQPCSSDTFGDRWNDDGVAVDGQRHTDPPITITSVSEAKLRPEMSHDREHTEREEQLVAADYVQGNRGQKDLLGS